MTQPYQKRFRSKIVMFLLSVSPILDYYQGPVFSYATWSLLFLLLYSLIKGDRFNSLRYPLTYYYYWGYLTIAAIIVAVSAHSFKLTLFIPGGVMFFVWSLMLGICIEKYDIVFLRKCMRIVFAVCAIVVVLQEMQYWATGHRFVAFLPISNMLSYGISYHELAIEHMYSERSSALFAEPAHFAQYVLLLLAIELFSSENRKKILPLYAILIIALLLLLRSGNGFVGLLVLIIVKMVDYIKLTGKNFVLPFLIIVPIAFWVFQRYASSEMGLAVLERTTEFENDESSRSYIRIWRGYYVYENLPGINQLLGISLDDLRNLNIPLLHMTGIDSKDFYFNGIQTVLIYNGLIGLILLFVFFYNQIKNGSILTKAVVLLLLTLSLMGQLYLSFVMLIITTMTVKNQRLNYEK